VLWNQAVHTDREVTANRPDGRIRFGRPLRRLLDETETGLSRPNWRRIIIIIIIIIIGISFMQGIYTHIPETNHVRRKHCVATILM
jgi:hypothetical protein